MSSLTEASPRGLSTGTPRRWVRRLPRTTALVSFAVLLPVSSLVLTLAYGLPAALAAALALAQTAPLLRVLDRPLPAWGCALAADVATALVLAAAGFPKRLPWPFPYPTNAGYVLVCLALGLRLPRRTLLRVWPVTAAVNAALLPLAPHGAEAWDLLPTLLAACALLLAGALRERAEAERRLAEQEAVSEAERARRTVLEERARIARELHDVVAHHMSVITVQADTAAYRLKELPPPAREEFASIAATARASLGEMRRLLGVLRSEDGPGERAPQPGLDRIAQLVEATERAHVPVAYTPCPASLTAGVPRAVELSAYRIVQEALANVVRHAPGAPTEVTLSVDGPAPERGDGPDGRAHPNGRTHPNGRRHPNGRTHDEPAAGTPAPPSAGTPAPPSAGTASTPSTRAGDAAGAGAAHATPDGTGRVLTVLVVNGPSPGGRTVPVETGGTEHGLVGMRERVRLLGGVLRTGPLPDGGFRVAARLPLDPPRPGQAPADPEELP